MTTDNIISACQRLQNHDASLTLLNLSCEGIGSEGVQKLSKSCSSSQTTTSSCLDDTTVNQSSPLVALWLEQNDISPKGAVALTQLLSASPSLKYLYMAHNSINNSGATALSSVALAQLEVCNLADNEIGPMGARAIANNLGDDKSTVKTFILESNHLRDQGATVIAESLKENTTLKFLDLRYNRIGKEGLTALRDMLRKDNMTLEFLFLEEDNDDHIYCQPSSRQPAYPRRKQQRRLYEPLSDNHRHQRLCECCELRAEIEYYLALNRAGRHSFYDMRISASLWPRIMAQTEEDPSVLYAMLSIRPDVVKPPS